jgi:hypothetical protein
MDKNLFWGERNIQKMALCVKGILAQDLGFFSGPFAQKKGSVGREARRTNNI